MTSKQRFKLGVHPINWVGEDVLEHGDHYTCETVLDEMTSLGFEGTEMSRKFPTDPKTLRNELEARGMRLTSQWKSVLFSDPTCRESELAAYRNHLEFLAEMGCTVVSTAEIGGSLHWDPRKSPTEKAVTPLTDSEWESLVEGLHLAGNMCHEYGIQLVYHHHAGTVVEQPDEIDRLMQMTDPELVSLLYDTGHAYYGGSDPLELLKKYYDRIRYIHFKDVRQHVLDEVRRNGDDFRTAVRKGVFTVPGTGCIDFTPIVKELVDRGYDGWVMIEAEQDPAQHNPYEYAKKSKAYIQQIVSELVTPFSTK
jgi:inosose dehydratase